VSTGDANCFIEFINGANSGCHGTGNGRVARRVRERAVLTVKRHGGWWSGLLMELRVQSWKKFAGLFMDRSMKLVLFADVW
jgi:hypothetical protein